MPSYKGYIEQWKVGLIRQRAYKMGFRAYEISDIVQELVPVLREFTYQLEHHSGASERTVLTRVVDHHLRKIVRGASRYSERIEAFGQTVSKFTDEEVPEFAFDIAQVVARLPEREQAICRGLAQGLSRAEIARDLGCSWSTVDRTIKQLRKHFEQLDLEGWVLK